MIDQSISGLALRASTLLNDQEHGDEFTRWSKCLLESFVVDSVRHLNQLEPGAFAHLKKQKAGPGSEIEITGCENVEKITRVWDGQGNRIVPTKASEELVKQLSKYPSRNCVRCGDKRMKIPSIKYAIDLEQGNFIYIHPPIPQGEEWTIEYLCYDIGDALDDVNKEFPADATKWIPAIMQYVLHLAYSQDFESEHSATRAQTHFQAFSNLLNTELKTNPITGDQNAG